MRALVFFVILGSVSSVAHAWPKEVTNRCPGGKRNPADLRKMEVMNSGLAKVEVYYYGNFHYMLQANGSWKCIMFEPNSGADYCGWSGKKRCVFDPNPGPEKHYRHSDRSEQWYNGYGPRAGEPAYDAKDGHYVGSW